MLTKPWSQFLSSNLEDAAFVPTLSASAFLSSEPLRSWSNKSKVVRPGSMPSELYAGFDQELLQAPSTEDTTKPSGVAKALDLLHRVRIFGFTHYKG